MPDRAGRPQVAGPGERWTLVPTTGKKYSGGVMNTPGVLICALLSALLSAAVPVNAESVAPAANQDAAQFLLTSIRVRNVLARGNASENRIGQEFWERAVEFVSLATDDREDGALYAPLLSSMESTLDGDALGGPEVNIGAVQKVSATLADEVKLLKGWGWVPGQRRGTAVEVRALDRQNRPVNGLYVWFDLPCCVYSNHSANVFQSTTSPATARVIPAVYYVRLLRGDRVVGHREVTVEGASAPHSPIDVVVE